MVIPILVALAVLYGSLIPFRFDLAVYTAANGFGLFNLGWPRTNFEDVITNVLVYMPVGFSIAWSLASRRLVSKTASAGIHAKVLVEPHGQPKSVGWVGLLGWISLAIASGAMVSLVAESLQTGIAERAASWLDFLLNVGGTCLGAALALGGMRTAERLLHRLGLELRTRPCSTLAVTIVAGLFILQLAPFDFVRSTAALHERFLQAGKLFPEGVLLPDSGMGSPVGTAKLYSALSFGAAGYFMALAKRERDRKPSTAFGEALRSGLILALILELLQLFVRSHTFELPILALHSIMTGLGAWLAIFVVDLKTRSAWRGRRRLVLPTFLLFGLIAVQVAILLIDRFGSPIWEVGMFPAAIRLKLPFESLWRQTTPKAATAAFGAMVTYASLGLCVSIGLRRARLRASWPVAAGAVTLLAATAESFRPIVSAGMPDLTNPLLAFAAVALTASLDVQVRNALN